MQHTPLNGGVVVLAAHEGHLRVVLPRLQSTAAAEPQILEPEIDPFLIVCRRRNSVMVRAFDSRCALEAIVVTDRRLPVAYR